MVFADLFFLYVFLPLCLLAYCLFKDIEKKNVVLIIFSLIFYAWGEPVYVLLLLFSAVFNWCMGLVIDRTREGPGGKASVALAIVVNLALLMVFKYSAFLVANFNAVFKTSVAVPSISLPIGISFFTFQALSYIIDVYWETVEAQPRFKNFLLYLSLFPQLIAGPIVRYSVVEEEITSRSTSLTDLSQGAMRVILGLAKKVIIANNLYTIVETFYGSSITSLSIFGNLYTVIVIGFGIFFFEDLSQLGEFFKHIFLVSAFTGQAAWFDSLTWSSLLNNLFLIVVAIVISMPVFPKVKGLVLESRRQGVYTIGWVAAILGCIVLLALSSILLVDATNNPFLYFRF